MKKILLFSIGMSAMINAGAQSFTKKDDVNPTNFKFSQKEKLNLKGTRGGSFLLSYPFAYQTALGISQTQMDQNSSLFTMFPDSNVRFNAPNSARGINYQSFGQVLDPTAGHFTSAAGAGDLLIRKDNAYSVDTVYMTASYVKRNTFVDTLIVSMVHSGGANGPNFYFTGQTADFNVDTTDFLAHLYPTSLYNKGAYQLNANGAPAAIVKRYLLTVNDSIGYTPGQTSYSLKTIRVPIDGFNVPAGEKALTTISFKPGKPWVAGDTIGNNSHILMLSYEPNGASTFMQYIPRDYNMSSIISKDTSNGWGGIYIPTVAFTNTYQPEIHDFTYHITCATCDPLAIKDVETNFSKIESFPNPATNQVNIEVTPNRNLSNGVVDVYTSLGVKVASYKVGNVNAYSIKTVKLNTVALSNGMYIFNVVFDGAKASGKFSINK